MNIRLHGSMFVHPGVWLSRNIIGPRGMSVIEAASRLGMTRLDLTAVLDGRASMTPDLARRCHAAFGIDPVTLLRMQSSYDAAQSR